MKTTLIKNGLLVNEGKRFVSDILIQNGKILKISDNCSFDGNCEIIDASGLLVLPGCIDDQVHFREPGLTHKGTIRTESRAAVAGGITTFMEMPNTVPNALTQTLLQDKYDIASQHSIANYSFFMGASNNNLEEVLKTNPNDVCGIKIFMGSSTGNMLVDSENTLTQLFSEVPMLIATHCEDEATVQRNLQIAKDSFGENIPVAQHPIIRSAEACYLSSSFAINLAKKHNTRLHILHISTAIECALFDNTIALEHKRITAEACVHHLYFNDTFYASKGNFIKWNPAVKTQNDQEEIWKAVLDDRIDVIATDHAPHTLEEKSNNYLSSPSGGPLAQHALLAMLEIANNGKISIERVVEKMAHAPAICLQVKDRGYLREGYFADIVLVNPNKSIVVERSKLLSKCGWSPFDGDSFSNKIEATFVNGNLVWDGETIIEAGAGKRLQFNRK